MPEIDETVAVNTAIVDEPCGFIDRWSVEDAVRYSAARLSSLDVHLSLNVQCRVIGPARGRFRPEFARPWSQNLQMHRTHRDAASEVATPMLAYATKMHRGWHARSPLIQPVISTPLMLEVADGTSEGE